MKPDKKESNTMKTMITDWLEKYGDSEIEKKVEDRLEQITKEIMRSAMENDFISKMDLLSTKFYSMSNEEVATLEALYEKYK